MSECCVKPSLIPDLSKCNVDTNYEDKDSDIPDEGEEEDKSEEEDKGKDKGEEEYEEEEKDHGKNSSINNLKISFLFSILLLLLL